MNLDFLAISPTVVISVAVVLLLMLDVTFKVGTRWWATTGFLGFAGATVAITTTLSVESELDCEGTLTGEVKFVSNGNAIVEGFGTGDLSDAKLTVQKPAGSKVTLTPTPNTELLDELKVLSGDCDMQTSGLDVTLLTGAATPSSRPSASSSISTPRFFA